MSAVTGATAALMSAIGVQPAAASWGRLTSRVSVATSGSQANALSSKPPQLAISASGRAVAFTSNASNLVRGDTNATSDVFVRDRLAGVTQRVSIGAAGQGNGSSSGPALSADGRYVAFTSDASNLVPGDTNGTSDVFVRDRLARRTWRVSVGADGQGNSFSGGAAISADGRYIAFDSNASNLVRRDTNRSVDVFVRDIVAGITWRVSVGAAGQAQGGDSYDPAISADGRYVAFTSDAANLGPSVTTEQTNVFVRDLVNHVTHQVTLDVDMLGCFDPALSADGRFIAFDSVAPNLVPGDTNGKFDVFVSDMSTGADQRVSVGAAGQGNGNSSAPALSADGRYVAFYSDASNLVPGDTNGKADVFVRDRLSGITRRASVGAAGQANGNSTYPAIASDGRSVAFDSAASNLVRGDTNRVVDVFVRDPLLDAATSS
jgi:Tol biopolymer transport system component